MADESPPSTESAPAVPAPVVLQSVEPPKRTIEDRIKSALAPEPVVEPEVEAAADPVAEPGSGAEQPEVESEQADEPVEVSTLGDLAEHLGVDVAELYNVAIPVDIDGERREITLSEYKDAYQGKEKLAKANQEAQALREQLRAQNESTRVETERAILQAAKLTELAESRLKSDMDGINWAQLREDDPSEWAAKRQDLMERQREIDAAKQEVEQAFRGHVEKHQSDVTEQTQEQLARERERLYAAIPEWQNQDTMKQEIAELRGYLGDNGFGVEEIDNVHDHRLIVMLRKARAFDQQNSKIEVAKKRVVKIGKKTTSPGTANTRQTARQDANASLAQNLKKSGRVEDAAAMIAARMKR